MASATDKSQSDAKIAFNISPSMAEEVDRILSITDLGSRPEVFRRAFTLLRIHLEAAERGREVCMIDPDRPNEKYIVTLPFNVHSPGSSE